MTRTRQLFMLVLCLAVGQTVSWAAPSCPELASRLIDSVAAARASRHAFRHWVEGALRDQGIELGLIPFARDPRFLRSTPAASSGAGFVTNNRWFYDELLRPGILRNRLSLMRLPLRRRLSALHLMIHTSYDAHFGQNDLPGHFYRWGGDLFDNDLPVRDDIRTDAAFGLDCSGFVASAFDVALKEGLVRPSELATQPFLRDRRRQLETMLPGVVSETRLNVSDFARLGREISPSEAGPGDYIVIPKADGVFPHIVSVVEIHGKLFIAESANNGSITRDQILKTGRYLTLAEALQRLRERGVKHALRSVLRQ